MENIIVWLEETIGLNPEIQHNLFETLLTVVLLWLAQRLLVTILKNSVENFERRYQWQKGIGYLSFIIGLIAIGIA